MTQLRRDLTGQKFGRWIVLQYARQKRVPSGQKKSFWLCLCECGVQKEVYTNSLTSGKSKSCNCLKQKYRKAYGESAKRHVYVVYKTRAKRLNFDFTLTEKEFHFLASKDCYYCGRPPYNKVDTKRNYGTYTYNGLDRIDNLKGYVQNNVVTCCRVCNLAKRELSQKDFFDMVKNIYTRHLDDKK